MSPHLNDNHRRALTTTLAHIDELLTDAEHAASAQPSAFARVASDLSPAERAALTDYIAQARTQMVDAAHALGLELPAARVSAVAAISTALTMAEIDLQDVDPSRLRGYGLLDDESATLVERVEADLTRALRRIQSYLARRGTGDFAARLARLEQAPFDAELLRILEQVTRRRGMVEFRPAIEALLERAEARTFEIAFLGRVSSGKSSLLNTILATSVLPVGVRPVTAVPTRIVWGEGPKALIHYADRRSEEIPVERLVDFVSEAGNPANRKQVLRAVLHLPAPVLKTGVVFVDTPGVGSLAVAGARETFAYLPRCDLGVVVLAAGGTIERDDVNLVRLLQESGIPATLVISKADLLSTVEQDGLREYVKAEVERLVGGEVSIHLVSAASSGSDLTRAWFDSELRPLLTRTKKRAEASARRKLATLREGVVMSLQATIGRAARPSGDSERPTAIEARIFEAEGILGGARRECERLADGAATLGDDILAEAARSVAQQREGHEDVDPATLVSRELEDRSATIREAVRVVLTDARDRLDIALAEMAVALSWPTGSDTLTLDLLTQPSVTYPPELQTIALHARAWFPKFLHLVERRVLSELRTHCEAPIEQALRSWSRELRSWSNGAIARLGEQFAAQAEPMRRHSQSLRSGTARPGDQDGIATDLATIAGRTPP